MAIVFIRAIILYVLLIFTVRLMGKHQIGELQPSELAITILISNIATLPIEDSSIPLFTGIIPILTLSCIDVIMSWVGVKSRRIRTLMSGKPIVIINNGEIDQKKLEEIRFTVDDLASALRTQGIFDFSEVQLAMVETTGSISVYQKYQYRNVTNEDISKTNETSINPPEIIIEQGKIIDDSVKRISVTKQWITDTLKSENIKLSNVFIMTADINMEYKIIKKESK